MGLKDTLNRVIQQALNRLNLQTMDIASDMSPKPSQSTIADTKAKDLHAFRTIITMLSYIQSPNTDSANPGPIGTAKEDRKELRVLDALSSLLIRQHEITAVVARPYDGSNLQVFASITYPSNTEPSLQPGGLWSWPFTVATNPRDTKINGHIDSLMNQTSLPYIGDHQDKLPIELVAAPRNEVLNIYLKNHWGRESFETHVWMLKTLLGQSRASSEDSEPFRLYSIAASFERMRTRMSNKQFSAPYLCCLRKQTTFPFTSLPSLVPNTGDRNRDEPFIIAIPFLARHSQTKIPNLSQHVANAQLIDIYNKDTYMEFHLLLCEFLSKFDKSLTQLKAVQQNSNRDLEEILKALKKVRIFGHYLMTMVASSAVEKHLQTISHLLVVDSRKRWTSEPAEPGESQDVDFQRLKPYSLRKGKPLLPWESYRDWLRLMVHYFDASQVLVTHVASWPHQKPDPLSITILSPPLPGVEMLPWTELLKSDHFFPTLPGESPGIDFISFLSKSCKGDISPTQIGNVTKTARIIAQQLESELDFPADEINKLAQHVGKCTSAGRKDDINRIVERLVTLKNFESQHRQGQFQAIVEMLETLTKRAMFHDNLKQGPLCCGKGFRGKHHCEAYIASLLTLLGPFGVEADFEERLNMLSKEEVDQIEELLSELQTCRHTIGVSKRCCPVCAFLLGLLNKHHKTNFVISDEHTNITPCALPEWLPGNIIHLMVVEFSRRLRKELTKLQESTREQRGRAGTSDTARASMDSIRAEDVEIVKGEDAVEAFQDA